ncbi:sugar phosphate isomerase/epimerase [Serratia sp. M24T3]|uniref:sugar phosphate isomerase/epimerase family protein n=1 Tax=Serratia sp. M24T3 TaxID=932213 RepID=UPI00025BA64C|nr:sugar phosphate isomerase/epimerase family protein [Serratia sp. M24T3]EIC86172.1 xylose isomerase domain-containing protein [Serratia sp. M24T3]
MQKALHGISTNYCNILTDARIAKETGYESLELLSSKLVRYLDNGGTTKKLKQTSDGYGLSVGCVNALLEIERYQGDAKKTMLKEATRLTQAAAELGCPTVQILALDGIDDKPEEQVMDIITENVDAIAKIGQDYGVRYQIEVIAFTKFRTLEQGLEVIRRVGKDNVGMVIDFWHLYASGSKPEDIARLDKNLIYGVHFCDGRLPKPGEAWDQLVLRNYMPGEGEIDIQAWSDAVKATGYDGLWSAELFSPNRWESDLYDIAIECRENMEKYIG